MGFFKSAGKVLGKIAEIAVLPATLPLDFIASKAGDNVIGNAARGISDATKIVGKGLQGQSISGTLTGAFNNVLPAAGIAAGAMVGAPGIGSNLGFNQETISGLTDLFGNNPAGTVNPVKGAATYQTPAPATPFRTGETGPSPVVIAAVVGGGALAAYLLFKGKK